jgi:hypothetical protein
MIGFQDGLSCQFLVARDTRIHAKIGGHTVGQMYLMDLIEPILIHSILQ